MGILVKSLFSLFSWKAPILFPNLCHEEVEQQQNKTKQNKTKQNKTKQNKTKQNKTKQKNLISTPSHCICTS